MSLWEIIRIAGLCFFAAMTLLGFGIMGTDKQIARRNGKLTAAGKRTKRRVPERTLFLIAALGGSVGVLAGMYVFRHKTRHLSFVLGVPAILAAQLLLIWLAASRLAG